jgi:hypothetical protein
VFLVVLLGLALALAVAGYALKALKEAIATQGGAKATLRHFYPLQFSQVTLLLLLLCCLRTLKA